MSIFARWSERLGREAARDALEQAKPAIRLAVTSALRDAIKSGALDEPIRNILRRNPRFRFIKWMQAEMQRVDPTLADKRAFEIARDTLNLHLADDKIEFGDPDYAWTKGGAIDLIHAYEIDYWERVE